MYVYVTYVPSMCTYIIHECVKSVNQSTSVSILHSCVYRTPQGTPQGTGGYLSQYTFLQCVEVFLVFLCTLFTSLDRPSFYFTVYTIYCIVSKWPYQSGFYHGFYQPPEWCTVCTHGTVSTVGWFVTHILQDVPLVWFAMLQLATERKPTCCEETK